MGLSSVELIMAIEEEFGVSIPDTAAGQMSTPRRMIDWLFAHQAGTGSLTEPGARPADEIRTRTREEIAKRVREIIQEQTAVDDFSDDDRFIQDMRIDTRID